MVKRKMTEMTKPAGKVDEVDLSKDDSEKEEGHSKTGVKPAEAAKGS